MLVLLDAGHGGIINGHYQTAGKRSPKWSDGSVLFEGEFNRAIVARLVERLQMLGIPYVNITPEDADITLRTRVRRANKYAHHPSFFLSIHANAGGGEGCEVFTAPGATMSDEIASIFGKEYKKTFPKHILRTDFSDDDLDKERRFYVLTKTKMPAVLFENFFMDNEEECRRILMTRQGRDKIANHLMNSVLRIQAQFYSERGIFA